MNKFNFNYYQFNVTIIGSKRRARIKYFYTAFIIGVISFSLLGGFNYKDNNFRGTWNVNVLKSNFGKLVPSDVAPKELHIIQAEDSIVIKKTFLHSNGSQNVYFEKFTFDGKSTERIVSSSTRRVTTLVWSPDKKSLIFSAHSFVNDRGFKWEYDVTDVWTLSNDGRSIYVQRKAIMPDRTEAYTAVFEKQ